MGACELNHFSDRHKYPAENILFSHCREQFESFLLLLLETRVHMINASFLVDDSL